MARTPLVNSSSAQVITGNAAPTAAPADPQSAAYFYLIDAAGIFGGEYVWDPVNQTWTLVPQGTGNWCEMETFGWEGPHNAQNHQLDYSYSPVSTFGKWVPVFGCDAPSASPIDFVITDKQGANIAFGTFPPNVRSADAATCNLTDFSNVPVTILDVVPGMQLAAFPSAGHASAPADGYGFNVYGRVIY